LAHACGIAEINFKGAGRRRGGRIAHWPSLVGENADVNALGLANQAVDKAASQAMPPAFVAAVSDENLGDTVSAGKVHDRVNRIFSVQEFDMSVQLPRHGQVGLKDLTEVSELWRFASG